MIAFILLISLSASDESLKKLADLWDHGRGIDHYCSVKQSQLPMWCSSFVEFGIVRPPRERRLRDWRGIRLKNDLLNSYQDRAYPDLIRAMRFVPAKDLVRFTDAIVAGTSCPRNFSAASLRRIETILPDPKAQAAMNTLYEHASACMRPSDEGYEFLHFRQALLRELWGDKVGARAAIQKATLTKNPKESARVKFWAGILSENAAAKNQHWTPLVREKPLTFHALLAAKSMSIDLKREIDSRPALKSEPDPKSQRALLEVMEWFKALVEKNYHSAAVKLAKEIVRNHGSKLRGTQILELIEEISGNMTSLDMISFLNESVDENPEWLNTQILKLLYPKPYFELISKKTLNLDTFLVLGLIRQESAFNPKAKSRANAQGLMQVLPATARRVDPKLSKNLFDIESNSSVGTKYLEELMKRFNDTELALAAYNAGRGRVDEWLKRYPTEDKLLFMDLIPFRETRNYVSSILRNNYWYHRIYEEDSKKIFADAADNALFKKSSFIRDLFKPLVPQ